MAVNYQSSPNQCCSIACMCFLLIGLAQIQGFSVVNQGQTLEDIIFSVQGFYSMAVYDILRQLWIFVIVLRTIIIYYIK